MMCKQMKKNILFLLLIILTNPLSAMSKKNNFNIREINDALHYKKQLSFNSFCSKAFKIFSVFSISSVIFLNNINFVSAIHHDDSKNVIDEINYINTMNMIDYNARDTALYNLYNMPDEVYNELNPDDQLSNDSVPCYESYTFDGSLVSTNKPSVGSVITNLKGYCYVGNRKYIDSTVYPSADLGVVCVGSGVLADSGGNGIWRVFGTCKESNS